MRRRFALATVAAALAATYASNVGATTGDYTIGRAIVSQVLECGQHST